MAPSKCCTDNRLTIRPGRNGAPRGAPFRSLWSTCAWRRETDPVTSAGDRLSPWADSQPYCGHATIHISAPVANGTAILALTQTRRRDPDAAVSIAERQTTAPDCQPTPAMAISCRRCPSLEVDRSVSVDVARADARDPECHHRPPRRMRPTHHSTQVQVMTTRRSTTRTSARRVSTVTAVRARYAPGVALRRSARPSAAAGATSVPLHAHSW